eukprot:CAMPEP_0172515734 /NCGR_PEP_ID=MMETSP1066-20121228/270192_1 /TAXON_ID=671091 /ORGANISM="Coscinodiscus wailesii, Strain CCMP2513" /LENGTH=217 /DNA_ID=CAMNT_0013296885 /DNA_START=135 /DNA_END=785 /DNA_ORIENTATION=+
MPNPSQCFATSQSTSLPRTGEHPLLIEPTNDKGQFLSPSTTTQQLPLTISYPATDTLAGGNELAMVILVDRINRRVLLEIPNRLGWRLHFGCAVITDHDDARTKECERWKQAFSTARRELNMEKLPLRPAGLMFFTFLSGEHASMRVRVLEATLSTDVSDSFSSLGGRWYVFDDVPYDRMWADDIVWLPHLLNEEGSYFEGHFVFDGGPSGESALVK